jgi:acyl-coenzyme A synthetase/AMP-(fatty) acid ligase
MTTPLHLRAPLQAAAPITGMQGVLASTMSLPADLAREAEAQWHVPVLEIYGSTEGGALAIRRTAREERWTPLPGVVLRNAGDAESPRFVATSPHVVPGGVEMGDLLELGADGRFLWLGRVHDLVKVAGKRASRGALEAALTGIPGVEDGAFTFVPEDEAPTEAHAARRLAAFYVSATLAPAEVIAALRGRIDPAFLPRPLHRVERLPRNANGKLPKAALDALFEQCRAQVVAPDHPALPGHFPGDPMVPGAMLLARVADALRARFPDRVPAAIRHARFHVPLRPDAPFTIETHEDGDGSRFRVRLADGTLIASGHWDLEARPG